MKRHESLVELSKDHHEGLLLAVRLQQGPRALLRLWSHDPVWQCEFIVRFWDEHLRMHFAAEEQHVFPMAVRLLSNANLVTQLKKEHAQMRAMIEEFRKNGTTLGKEHLTEKLKEFGSLLENHIRCEEREFFPLCEHHFPDDAKHELLAAMASYRD